MTDNKREGYVAEEWLGQILIDGTWTDYSRGTERAARAWQAADRENRRVVDWIRKENILVANTPPIEEVNAEDVQEGDFLPGIGNGYVIEAREIDGYNNRVDIGQHYSVPSDGGWVIITFNDRDGEENYLVMASESRVSIRRGAAI